MNFGNRNVHGSQCDNGKGTVLVDHVAKDALGKLPLGLFDRVGDSFDRVDKRHGFLSCGTILSFISTLTSTSISIP
jgi:hypothetical protein